MRYVFCTIGSIGVRGGVYIPVSVSIPEAEWRALAERLSQRPVEDDRPALAVLMTCVLPRVAELSELPRLREELARVAPGLPEGPAQSAAGLLREFLDQAALYVDAWRADGERTRLSAAFQRLEDGYAVRSEPPVDRVPRGDAESR